MTGFILTRESTDGSKRYDACWRVNGKQKSKSRSLENSAPTPCEEPKPWNK